MKAITDRIDQLLSIVSAHTPDDRIDRITLAPWTLSLVRRDAGLEVNHMAFGYKNSDGEEVSCCATYLARGAHGVAFSIVDAQTEAFRLWDCDGREVFLDHLRSLPECSQPEMEEGQSDSGIGLNRDSGDDEIGPRRSPHTDHQTAVMGYVKMGGFDYLLGLLSQLEVVDALVTILNTHTEPGPVKRVTVAPRIWNLLKIRHDIVIQYIAFGGEIFDEHGREKNIDGIYIYTQDSMVGITVEPEQETAYRLWDRAGRELVSDRRGWYYVVSDPPTGSENCRHQCNDRSTQHTATS